MRIQLETLLKVNRVTGFSLKTLSKSERLILNANGIAQVLFPHCFCLWSDISSSFCLWIWYGDPPSLAHPFFPYKSSFVIYNLSLISLHYAGVRLYLNSQCRSWVSCVMCKILSEGLKEFFSFKAQKFLKAP